MKTNQPSLSFFPYHFEIKNKLNLLTKKKGGTVAWGEKNHPTLIQYNSLPVAQVSIKQCPTALAGHLKLSEGRYLPS